MAITEEETIREEWDLLKNSGLLSQIGCSAGLQKTKGIYNFFKWNDLMTAPKKFTLKGYMFKFEIDLPQDYPNSAPKVTCKTDVYHMNISSSGNVCVSSIKNINDRKTAHDISTVLLFIFIILVSKS